jgi:hypothetical protein
LAGIQALGEYALPAIACTASLAIRLSDRSRIVGRVIILQTDGGAEQVGPSACGAMALE